MIFYFIMPSIFGGIGNIFVPILFGVIDIVYPRINNISVIIIFVSFNIIFLSYYNEYSNGVGWTLYPPLSTIIIYISSVGIDIIIISLMLLGMSSSLTSINFIVMCINIRCYGIILNNICIYV